jgi:chromosomal replication initiator protein
VDKQSLAEAAEELWRQATDILRGRFSDATWRTWLQAVEATDFQDGVLTLAVPNPIALQRIQSSFGGIIEEALHHVLGAPVAISLVVQTSPRPEVSDLAGTLVTTSASILYADELAGGQVIDLRNKGKDTASPASPMPTNVLIPRYTFDEFVIGASNRFAHAAALSVAEAPARSYNPLFIYGQSGLGKTHLLHAIGHHVRQVFPAKRLRYVSTETFLNEFIEAIRTNTRQAFKRWYREVDVLLVDDIQFMANHERFQEEFFHTFDSLHGAHSQIVISSDRPPRAIATLEDRLRSRFEWGLITDIQPPEFETRLAILRHKAVAEGFSAVPGEVLGFIAMNVANNVRELEGALIRVAAYSSLSGLTCDEDLARHVLADVVAAIRTRVITPQLILDETAKMFGWTVEELCGKSRRRPLVTARQIGMYVFRELTDHSYPQIARQFGGRDHTTVMHAVEKITNLIAERRQIYDQVTELINRIKVGEDPS